MRKPNTLFLSLIAVVALLPHAPWHALTPNPAPVAAVEPDPPASLGTLTAAVKPTPLILESLAVTGKLVVEAGDTMAAEEPASPWDVLPIKAPTTEPLAALEEIYLTEAFDPAWAAPLEANFYQVFDTLQLRDSAIEQAECRTTLCRFAIVHQNSAAQDAFVRAFLSSPLLPLNEVTLTHHDEATADGGVAAVYFLARNELAQLQD
jgi:hypothetical protein